MIKFNYFLYFCVLIYQASSKPMNVLLFIFDDLRPALGCYGDKNAFTPNIDRYADDSIIFENAFAQQALCAPSRNSFLTSRRPDTLHLYDFYNYWRHFSGNFTTLPQYFKENGFKTMSIGKVFHPGISSNFSDDQPYSWSYHPFHPPSEKWHEEICSTKHNPFLKNNVVCPVDLKLQPGRTLPDIESKNKAIKFILKHKHSKAPIFLAVGFHKPHIPLRYPKAFKKYHPLKEVKLPLIRKKPHGLPNVAWNPWTDIRCREDIKKLNIPFPFGIVKDKYAKLIKQSYYAAVSYADSLLGEIMNILISTGLNNNTIVGLIGDHGWSLGENGEWSKFSNFDVATRVPFILKVPGLTNSKKYGSNLLNLQYISEPVELVDLFPTLVDLVGLKSLSKCGSMKNRKLCTEGKSLKPLIMDVLTTSNRAMRSTWDIVAFSQYPRPGEFPTENPNSDKPRLNEINVMGCSVRTQRYRYTEWLGFKTMNILWNDTRVIELYDHKFDPYESNNLNTSETYYAIRSKLAKLLRDNWVHLSK